MHFVTASKNPVSVVFPDLALKFGNQGLQDDVFGMRRPEGCANVFGMGQPEGARSLFQMPIFVVFRGAFHSRGLPDLRSILCAFSPIAANKN